MKKFLSLALALVMVLAVAPMMIPAAKAAWLGQIHYATSAPVVDGTKDAVWPATESMAETRPNAFNGNTMKYWVMYDEVNVYTFIEVYCPNGYNYMDKPNGNFVTPRFDWDDNNSVWQTADVLAQVGLNSDGTIWTSGDFPGNKGQMAGSVSADGKTVYFEITAPRAALHATSATQLTAGQSFMAGAHFNGINSSGAMQNMGATFDNSWATTQTKPTTVSKAANHNVNAVTTAPKIDGKVNVSEWGTTADLAISQATGEGKRLHFVNSLTGLSRSMPDTAYYWSHDDQYLYLAVVIGESEPSVNPDNPNLKIESDTIFVPGHNGKTANLLVNMGKASFTISHSTVDKYTLKKAPSGVQVGFTFENNIATYEIAIPLSAVTDSSSFDGYLQFYSHPATGSTASVNLFSSAMTAAATSSNPAIRDNFTLSNSTEEVATRGTLNIKLDGQISVEEWGEAAATTTTDKAGVEYFIRQDDKGMYIAARANSTLAQTGYQSGLVLRSATAGYLGCTVIRGAAHTEPGSVANNFAGAIVRDGNIITAEIFVTWAQLKVTDGSGVFNGRIEWHDYTNASTDTFEAIGGAGNHTYSNVEKIAILKAPAKTEYAQGEAFDPTGMVLYVTYKDGTTASITSGFAVPDGVVLQLGQTSVTVTYGGLNVTVAITVTKAEGDETAWEPSATGAPGAAPDPDAAPVETPAVEKPHGFGSYGPAGQPIPAPCDKAIRGPKAKF